MPPSGRVPRGGHRFSARRTLELRAVGRSATDQRTRLLARDVGGGRAHLASAMFLGVREELDPEASQAFLETGTVHLLVISGLNVGILAACLLFGLRAGWLRCAGHCWRLPW